MRFRVTILGSNAARPTVDGHNSAHALNVHEQFYLVDCGEGTQTRLVRMGINPMKIRAVFISHLHGDHFFGLPGLVSTLGLEGRTAPLDVFAPWPVEQVMEAHFRFFDTSLPYPVRVTQVDHKVCATVFENRVMEVLTIPLRHRVPCCGYLFREKEPGLNVDKAAIARYGLGVEQIAAAKRGDDVPLGDGTTLPAAAITYRPYRPRAYAYCSDTTPSGKVAELTRGVDLLYHEATFASADKALAEKTGHSTAAQAASVAARAGAGRLIAGHISSRYKDPSALLRQAREIFPNTDLAVEGTSFEIEMEKSR